MKNVLIVSPDRNDGTSWYRAAGILPDLRRKCTDLRFAIVNEISWSVMAECDLLYLQRPHTPSHFNIAKLAESMNVPIWLDQDDNILDVPVYNPSFNIFAQYEKPIKQLIGLADVVTVTNEQLGKVYQPFLSKGRIEIVPNAIDLHGLLRGGPIPENLREKIILWRGGNSHDGDVFNFVPEIRQMAIKHPDWKWHFFGVPFWQMLRNMPPESYVCHPWTDTPKYMRSIQELKPAVAFCCLEDNIFNQSKSNISYIESAWCGATMVASDLIPFKNTKSVTFSGPQDFMAAMEIGMNDAMNGREIWRSAWDHVRNDLNLSSVNYKRVEIILSLFK